MPAPRDRASDASPSATPLPIRIALVGLRGSGKSTVGPLLAARLRIPFHDSDAVLTAEGSPPGETIRAHGVEEFRRREARCIATLARSPAGVLALGGGAVESEGVRSALAGWTVVHLDAPDAELARRLSAAPSPDRPPLTELSLADEIAHLRERRASLYSTVATVMIATGETEVAAVVDTIIAALDLPGARLED